MSVLHSQSSRDGESRLSDEERARIQARLQALNPARSNDQTRKLGNDQPQAVTGNERRATHPATATPQPEDDVVARAYLLTADGGILAEIPCHEEAGAILIGRGKSATVRIADPHVHRSHAEIRWDAAERAHFITHAGGENGTYVNRHRVQKRFRLVGGEQIRLGGTKLVYRIRR